MHGGFGKAEPRIPWLLSLPFHAILEVTSSLKTDTGEWAAGLKPLYRLYIHLHVRRISMIPSREEA